MADHARALPGTNYRMSMKSKLSARPRIACEICADRVLAGKLAETGGLVDECAVRELPPGSVVPDLTEPNILQPEVVRKAINDAVGSVAGRLRDIIGILPDAAVRVVLLDFDTLPPNAVEAEGVVRFRLKKSLPFDVDKAKVSYHVQQSLGGLRLVAAVACSCSRCVIWARKSLIFLRSTRASYQPMIETISSASVTRPRTATPVPQRIQNCLESS